jgi:hypothetical protein
LCCLYFYTVRCNNCFLHRVLFIINYNITNVNTRSHFSLAHILQSNSTTREAMYLQGNNIALSPNVYTSSAILTAGHYCYSNRALFIGILFLNNKLHLGLRVKFPIFRLSGQILLKASNINFTKIRPVGAEPIHVDRQTDSVDVKKLIGAFREKTCVILKKPLVHLILFPHSYLRYVLIT